MLPILEIRGLAVEFDAPQRTLTALSDVDLSLEEGEAVALLGESGSGKSLLARSILRLLPSGARQRAGEIRWEGSDLSLLPEAEMDKIRGRRVGYVFQEPAAALDPVRSVGSQLAEVLRVAGGLGGNAARRRARELFGEVGFSAGGGSFDRYPHELSGGMRQRVVIAAALAGEPKLLLADEPTSSLDRSSEQELLDLFLRLREQHSLALLFITHDVAVARRVAGRVAVLYSGRIVEDAPAAPFFSMPRHPYSAALLRISEARRRRVRGRLPALRGSAPALADRTDSGCAFAPRCPEAFERCRGESPGVYPFEQSRVRCFLEDVAGGGVR